MPYLCVNSRPLFQHSQRFFFSSLDCTLQTFVVDYSPKGLSPSQPLPTCACSLRNQISSLNPTTIQINNPTPPRTRSSFPTPRRLLLAHYPSGWYFTPRGGHHRRRPRRPRSHSSPSSSEDGEIAIAIPGIRPPERHTRASGEFLVYMLHRYISRGMYRVPRMQWAAAWRPTIFRPAYLRIPCEAPFLSGLLREGAAFFFLRIVVIRIILKIDYVTWEEILCIFFL